MRRSYESFCKRLNGLLRRKFELYIIHIYILHLAATPSKNYRTMGNWERREIETFKTKKMSDELKESVCWDIIRRLFHANLKLGTHQKLESKNSLYALAILYPFNNGRKLCQKKLSEKF